MVSLLLGVHTSTRELNPIKNLLLPRLVTMVWEQGQLPRREEHSQLESEETSASPSASFKEVASWRSQVCFFY